MARATKLKTSANTPFKAFKKNMKKVFNSQLFQKGRIRSQSLRKLGKNAKFLGRAQTYTVFERGGMVTIK